MSKQDVMGLANVASTSSARGGRRDAAQDAKNAPWIEKFRPQTLDEVAAHTEIIDTSGFTKKTNGSNYQIHQIHGQL